MQIKTCLVLFIPLSLLLSNCSSTERTIDKSKSRYGMLKYYLERNSKEDSTIKRVYASIDSNGVRNYFYFEPNRIYRRNEVSKNLSFIVFSGIMQTDNTIYRGFTSLDTIVLSRGIELLDLYGLKNFKRLENSSSYYIEVSYLHGYPKNKKFNP